MKALSVRRRASLRLVALISVLCLSVSGLAPAFAHQTLLPSAPEESQAKYKDARSVSGARPFSDVPRSSQFSGEITWLAAQEVTTGWPDGSFRPVDPVNRDAMAAFMYRLMGKQPFNSPPQQPFVDVAPDDQFYKEIAWLAETGISKGWEEANSVTTFRPLISVNRDAMAAFMYRMAGSPDFSPPATSPFADLVPTTQFYKEITWLSSTGISKGWDEGGGVATYRPLQPVNRDAMAAFMYRFTGRDQPVASGVDVTANLGPRAAGHASALIRLTVRNAPNSSVVSVNGAPALAVEAGRSVSTTVLTPLTNAGATISATTGTSVRVDLIATFDGHPDVPGSTIALPQPITRADTRQGLAGTLLSSAPAGIGLTGQGGVPTANVRAVYATATVEAQQDTTLLLGGQELEVRQGVTTITTIVTPNDAGNVEASLTAGTGQIRLDVRGYIPDAIPGSASINVGGSFVPAVSRPRQAVDVASGKAAAFIAPRTQDSAVVLALVSADPAASTAVLATSEAEVAAGSGAFVDAARGAAPQLAFIALEPGEPHLHISAGAGSAGVIPLGTLLSNDASAGNVTAPSVEITSPATGSAVDLSGTGMFTIEGTVEASQMSLGSMVVSVGGEPVGVPHVRQTADGNRWVFETSAPASGDYSFEVQATDRSGSRSSSTVSVAVTLPETSDTVMAEDLVILGTGTNNTLSAVSAEDVTFAEKPQIVPGEVIVSAPTPSAPEGILRRVTSLDETATGWVAETIPAAITDAIRQADFDQTIVLDDFQTGAIDQNVTPGADDTTGVELINDGEQPVWVATTEDVDLSPLPYAGDEQTLADAPSFGILARHNQATGASPVLDHQESLTLSIQHDFELGKPKRDLSAASAASTAASKAAIKASGGITVGGKAQLGLGLRLVSDISSAYNWGHIDVTVHDFSIVLATSAKVTFSAEAYLRVKTTEELKKRVAQINLKPTVFFVGAVPVVITNTLDVSVDSKFSAQVAAKVEGAVQRTQDLGFRYTTVGGLKDRSTAPRTTYSTPIFGRQGDAEVSGAIEASIGPTVEAITALYDVAGPKFLVGVRGGVLGEVVGDNTGYRFAVSSFIEGQLRVGVRLSIPIIDKTLVDSVPLSISKRFILQRWDWDLATAFPPAGPTDPGPAPEPDPSEDGKPEEIKAISGGYAAAYSLTYGGKVRAWGDNETGALGDGTTSNRVLPVDVSGLTDVTSIAGGTGSAHAVKSDGTVWSWGYNDGGTLGDGTTTTRLEPVQVPGLRAITSVDTSYYSVYALDADGTVWSWGHNWNGELGDGTTANRLLPVKVLGLAGVRAISSGWGSVYALKNDGTVWSWGKNVVGELGDGTETNSTTPVQVSGLANVQAIAAGAGSAYALKTDGTVWAWGYGLQGQLGDGTDQHRKTPVQVSGLDEVTGIATFNSTAYAVRTDGSVWGWGDNYYGQLGISTSWPWHRSLPMQLDGLVGVKAIAAGHTAGYVLGSDGVLRAWGNNQYGQLGDGTTQSNLSPVTVGQQAG